VDASPLPARISSKGARTSESESRWSSVEKEIARLLPEVAHEEERSHPPGTELPQDGSLLSDVLSTAYRWLQAILVVGGAALVISLLSPCFAWIAALVAW
jgi:hypothetical protein